MLGIFGQEEQHGRLAEAEVSLYNQFEQMYSVRDDQLRSQINDSILSDFESVLTIYESFDYSFDSLRRTGRIYSPDRKLRIITWNIPWQDGTHTYFGFIQYPVRKAKRCEAVSLKDHSGEIKEPENAELGATNWFGALYYGILVNKFAGKKYYTLLGFDINDRLSNKKIIDVLTFEDTIIKFGKPVFEPENRDVRDRKPDRGNAHWNREGMA